MNVGTYIFVSVLVVSLVSLVGVFTLAINEQVLKKILLYLVSFSAGALLGDVFLHILPEIAESGFALKQGVYLVFGIVLFFILERFILWQHQHGEHSEHVHSVVYLTQVADSLHNFLDGLVIAAAYLVSVPLGIATTLAVIFHEIPQEVGNFAILIHGGWKKSKALFWNFISALFAGLGALVAVVLFRNNGTIDLSALLCFGAASFIYIALSDIIPELHREKSTMKSFWQMFWLILGILAMASLLLLEK